MPPTRPKLLTCICLGTMCTIAACTGGGEAGRNVPDAGGKSYALLAVTLSEAREGATTIGASARLFRYRGLDAESAQVLAGGAQRDVARAPGCVLVDDEALLNDALATSPPDATVQMLDAGEILFHVAGQTLKLAPRYVPDIVPFVSGVVYDAEVPALEPFAEGGDAYIAAFGGPQVGRFSAPADVPAAPRILGLAGALPDDLTVSWAADPGARGQLQIALASDGGPALRCQVADTGRFRIPAALGARVAEAARGESLTLSLERTRRTPFSAPGLDAAEVEVTVRDVVSVR